MSIIIYLFAFKYPTYKIINNSPYSESIEIDGNIYKRSYWRADVFDRLIGFANSPKWGIYRSSDPDYSDFVVLKYLYSLDHRPQPEMFRRIDSKIKEPCPDNMISITFCPYKNPDINVYDQTLIENIFNVLDTADSITVSDMPTKREYLGSLLLINDQLPDLTFELELILFKDINVYYLSIYNQNMLVPISDAIAEELRGYLK